MRDIHLAILLTTLVSITSGLENARIRTHLGEVNGIIEHVRKEKVYQFRNIPYAQPPVGDLRFAKSRARGYWNGVLDATKFGSACMQPAPRPSSAKYYPNFNQSEDCLSLNVYVPRRLATDANRSVMIWIHGGGYVTGQGMLYDGSYLALTGDVIVVTINYRLGVFGFLSTTNSDLKGNYGLWDQRLAMQWVQANIADYGGNPNSVTIFGESAGGFSVSLHAIITQNQGLFHRVISQSGSALSPFATIFQYNAYNIAKVIGTKYGCANNSGIPHSYKSCMRRIHADDLMKTANSAFVSYQPSAKLQFDPVIGPVVDYELLPSRPDILMMNKTSPTYQFFKSLDFMAGNVNTEGSLFLRYLLDIAKQKHFNISLGIPTDVFCNFLVSGFVDAYFEERVNSTLSIDRVCSLYGASKPDVTGDNALGVFSDVYFIAPTIKSVMKHSESNLQSSTYQYMFNRPLADPYIVVYYPPWWRKDSSAHGAELSYLFGLEDLPTNLNISVAPSDIRLAHIMEKYWTNFAKTGNPNSDNVPTWGSYDVIHKTYIDLNTTVTQGRNLYGTRTDLWLKGLPKLVHGEDPNTVIGRK